MLKNISEMSLDELGVICAEMVVRIAQLEKPTDGPLKRVALVHVKVDLEECAGALRDAFTRHN